MESMSSAPYLLPQARFGYRMGDAKMLDAMVHDGLTNPFSSKQMFVEATEVGDELELTRPDLDRWALRSHERALAAIDDGRMADETVAVTIKGRKGDTVVEVDEGPRRDTSLERLAALPGLTGPDGSHTAGNSPGVNDGGGALGGVAAFFDLDNTLIAGSSAFHFARAARRAGLITRRRLAADAWANVVFRLRGSTDAGTDALRERISKSIEGVRQRDLMRLSPQVLAGILPRVFPQTLEIAFEHQDAGRRVYIVTAAGHEVAEML